MMAKRKKKTTPTPSNVLAQFNASPQQRPTSTSTPNNNSTQVFPGDFGDGGAVGAPVTAPTPIRTPTPVSTPTTTTTTTPTPTFETSGGGSQVFPGDFGDGGAVGTGVTPETYTSPVTPESTPGSTQVFPGDFGNGGAVGEFVTPATPTGSTGPTGPGSTGPTGPGPTGPTGPVTFTATDGKVFTDQAAFATYQASLNEQAEKKRREGQSAYSLLFAEFDRYGMGDLVKPLEEFIKDGLSEAEFTLRLRGTKEYQDRFAANKERITNGLRALSEAEYIGLEDQYQNVMRQYGLPETYYSRGLRGKQAGFEKFIAGDVSAAELEDRIMTAQDRVLKSNPQVLDAIKAFYGDSITNGDILAYTLDPKNAIKDIQRKVTAAEIGGAALSQTDAMGKPILTTSLARAEELQRYGVDKEAATAGYSAIGGGLQRGSELASIYQQDPYAQSTAESEVFKLSGQQEARKQRQKITGLEKAAFGGQSGLTGGALARDRAGGY
jgi:hypothetical protein